MTGRADDDGERLREGFFRDGFLVVRELFTGDEVAWMRAALDRVVDQVRADPGAFDARYTLRGPDSTDTWGVNYIYLPPLYDPALAIPFENRDLLDVFRVLLGPQLRFGNAHALWSPERSDYELYWHRDSGEYDATTPPRQGTHIQFNVALTDDACFRCVPGSQARVPTTLERTQVEQQGTSPLPSERVVACEPGDVLLTNSDLIHRRSCRAGHCAAPCT